MDINQFTRRSQEAIGAAIESANSVEQALSSLKQNWPDVLISDIGFARQDGYALIREVKELETQGRRPLPAMAVTAYARQEDQDRAIAAGFNRYLAKPIRTKAIIEMVHELWTEGRAGSV